MITLTMAWYVWPILVALVLFLGAIVGQWDAFRIVKRRELQRELDAKRRQLDFADTVNHGYESARNGSEAGK